MHSLIFYTLASTALWYLGSRALITHSIWTRYPPKVAKFFDCSACSGFWYGFVFAATLGRHRDYAFLDLAGREPYTPFVVGLCMIAAVPICAGLVQWGFWQAGEAATHDDDS